MKDLYPLFLFVFAPFLTKGQCQLDYDWVRAYEFYETPVYVIDEKLYSVYTSDTTLILDTFTVPKPPNQTYNLAIAEKDLDCNFTWVKPILTDAKELFYTRLFQVVPGEFVMVVYIEDGSYIVYEGDTILNQVVPLGSQSTCVIRMSKTGVIWSRVNVFDIGSLSGFDSLFNRYYFHSFTDTLMIDTNQLISAGKEDVVVAKVDSSDKIQWIKQMGGSGTDFRWGGTIIDQSGNIYLRGRIENSTFMVDSILVSSNWTPNETIVKINSDGKALWVKDFGSSQMIYPQAFSLDSKGRLIVFGTYRGDIGSRGSSVTDIDFFLARVNADGSDVQILEGITNNGEVDIGQVTVDEYDNIYFNLAIWGEYSFEGNQMTNSLIYSDKTYMMGMLDSSLSVNWIRQTTGLAPERVVMMTAVNSDNIFFGGNSFGDTLQFDSLIYYRHAGDPYSFLGKLTCDNQSPTAWFDFFQDSCTSEYQFYDQSSRGPVSWLWNFGDGSTSNLKNPNHVYQNPGTYTVRLISTNIYGSDTVAKTLTHQLLHEVDFVPDKSNVGINETVAFTDKSINPRTR